MWIGGVAPERERVTIHHVLLQLLLTGF